MSASQLLWFPAGVRLTRCVRHRFNDTSFPNGTNYAPSLIGNVTVAFIRDALTAPAASRKPFFAYSAVHSPHTPSTPAPWYAHTYPFVRAPVRSHAMCCNCHCDVSLTDSLRVC